MRYILLFFLLFPFIAQAKESTLLLQEVNNKYLNAKDITITFTHETFFVEMDESSLGGGTLFIKNPGKMRWNYNAPFKDEIYINENTVVLVSPSLGQAIISTLDMNTSSLVPLRLLMGTASLADEFNVDMKSKGDFQLFTLTPKEKGVAQISKLELSVKDSIITSIIMYLKNENYSVFKFSGYKWNSTIADDLFKFVPSSDIEVIDHR